jgi:hypothetical protein
LYISTGVLGWAKCCRRTVKLLIPPVPRCRLPSSSRVAWPIQSCVPCVLCSVSLPPIYSSRLLLLQIAPTCHADFSGRSGARMWLLFVVTLDATSSRPRSCGATSWVRVMLLVSGLSLSLSFLFHFSSSFFSFMLS